MAKRWRATRHALLGALLGLSLLGAGCVGPPKGHMPLGYPVPRELNMTSHPPHVIEPGDALVILLRSLPLPKPPYRIRPLDELKITIEQVPQRWALEDVVFIVEPEGELRFGPPIGVVRVLGLTLDQAGKAMEDILRDEKKEGLRDPLVIVALESTQEVEPVPDGATVRPDGTISLGGYGAIYLAGMTEQQARTAIEEHLAEFLMKPEIYLEVSPDNNKAFYLVVERPAGDGDSVTRVPMLGRETVLEVLSVIDGLPIGSNSHRIWVARPAPADAECEQILLVDWEGIVQRGRTATNYQLLPGDRLYIKADPWIKAEQVITKVTAPFTAFSNFAQNMLTLEETFRLAFTSAGGLFGSGFFGFGFPGFGGGFGF